MDRRFGAKWQLLIGILTIGLLALDTITVGEAVILTFIGGMYNRIIRISQDIRLMGESKEES